MLKNTEKPSDPAPEQPRARDDQKILSWVKNVFKPKAEPNLRETLEGFIEDLEESPGTSIAAHERTLIANVLRLRDLTVTDIMIPRADVAAIEISTSGADLMELLAEKQFSRFPVYRETLDEVVGSIHIKDIMACIALKKDVVVSELVRTVPIVSPSMPLLDLLLFMRQTRKHLVLVVDEYGGIDGLVTIGDVVESIIGQIEDEFGTDTQPEIIEKPDGTLIVDGRYDLQSFEEKYGRLFTDEEREDVDTMAGLVFTMAGRVPARGEVLTHESGMVFEILEADLRRVNQLRVRNIPRKE